MYKIISFRFTLTNQQLENISCKIVELFPCETKETYYVPPIRKTGSPFGRSIAAKGKLVDRYRNCRYKLRKTGILETCSGEKDTDTESDVDINKIIEG